VERYVGCPFQYFASTVLSLDEDDDGDDIGLDPRRRGTLLHEVFHAFFVHWAAEGRGSITPAALPEARTMFAGVVDRALDGLAKGDRITERARLLGTAGAPGLGERVFRLEAVRPEPVVERLLEVDLRGTYEFGRDTSRMVTLKGVADRIDLLADGTLRVIDYKSGKAPDPHRSIQLAVYALCAEQKLDGYRGRQWRTGEAAYIALADRRSWVTVVAHADDRQPIEEGRARFLAALDGIALGAFPPAPADRRLCTVCAFAAVCRKDYVGDVA
jgi:RecB family exonuclease